MQVYKWAIIFARSVNISGESLNEKMPSQAVDPFAFCGSSFLLPELTTVALSLGWRASNEKPLLVGNNINGLN